MKKLLLLSGLALVALAAAPALSADAPAPSSAASAAPARQRLDQGRERVLEHLRERGLAIPSGVASGVGPAPSGSGAAGASAPLGLREELARKWSELSSTRLERRERHRAALIRELGQHLSDPQIKNELKQHATRVAELARLEFLAQNARSGAARETLLARIARLSAREQARHQRRLAALAGPVAAPSASAATPAPPAPSAPGPKP